MDNPDQRLAVDVRNFTDTSITFSVTMLNALIDLVSFSGGLLRGGPCCAVLCCRRGVQRQRQHRDARDAHAGRGPSLAHARPPSIPPPIPPGILFTIYPPLFGALLVYSVGGTALSLYIGKPLVGLNFQQEAQEANFRCGRRMAMEAALAAAPQRRPSPPLR